MDIEAISREAQLDMAAVQQLREVFEGDLTDVIDTYLRDTPEQLASIEAAIELRDLAAIGRAAHSLKASSYSMGARAVGELSQQLEAHVRAQGDVEEVRNLLAALKVAATVASAQLRAVAANQDPRLAKLA